MSNLKKKAEGYLRAVLGADAAFREGQWSAIETLVVQKKRLLLVQSTGWGKSRVYLIAAKLLRSLGQGPTIIISPSLAFAQDQLSAIRKLGLIAASLHDGNRDNWDNVSSGLLSNRLDMLLISPEQLGDENFRDQVLPAISRIGLLVVEEAHCVSDFSHDFVPDYRRIAGLINNLPSNIPMLATTATANDQVVADIQRKLKDIEIACGPLVQESWRLKIINLDRQAEKLAWLAQNLAALPKSGLIYCITVKDCELVLHWLQQRGFNVAAYYPDLPLERRALLEQQLRHNEIKALVVMTSLGLSFDQPELGFLLHYQNPGSVDAYCQQVASVGIDCSDAMAILLTGREDDDWHERLINTSFPQTEHSLQVTNDIQSSDGLGLNDLLSKHNLGRTQLEWILKLLEMEGLITKEGSAFHRTARPWTVESMQYQAAATMHRRQLSRMQQLAGHAGCLMEFIRLELNTPDTGPCGRCANCVTPALPTTVDHQTLQEAIQYLTRDHQPIRPRKLWPGGGVGNRRGKISEAEQLRAGLALCSYGDPGWGKLVQNGKHVDGKFSDDLVRAMVKMIRQRLAPEPFPTWVTAVPSLRQPEPVADFANRLADALRLPFRPVLIKTKDSPPQKSMHNSHQQARNALESSFGLSGLCPRGAVLLVDDLIDSGWTLTVCGELLRKAGSGPVFPVVLATAGGGVTD